MSCYPFYPERASLEGLAGEIFKLVSRRATPEQWSEWLRVPLEHAAADGNADLFNALIEAGANGRAGWRGCEGRTLFDAAAVGGNAEVVSALVAAGAGPDVNVVSAAPSRSALSLAISLGHEEAAKRLVSAGADVNFYDAYKEYNVLMEAVREGCEELVNCLLSNGADPNRNTNSLYGTPLLAAASAGREGIVSTLLTRGADKDARDVQGLSPLMWAARTDYLAVVNTLLAAGADVQVRDVEGSTALAWAAKRGHIEVLKVLLGRGEGIHALNIYGQSALHLAAEEGQLGAIDALIETGADIELKDSDGWSPLCCATLTGNWNSMYRLLEHGANIDTRDTEGNTPLHNACSRQKADLATAVELVLQCEADETAVNNDGETPAQMLRSPPRHSWLCSPEDVERAQLLVARAPWRRRRWLVILRSRASLARAVGCDDRDEDGRGERGRATMATGGHHTREGESAVVEKAGNGCAIGSAGEGGSLGAVVASLIGLELEGVFRTVVGFL